ncbi:MAG: serine/threonine-protein kinase [Streptosporangiales bacterium]|nr:serine/threonine-protein kinase [Streptosporangiales bacterium]
MTEAMEPSPELLAGRYRIDGRLGKGGMSLLHYGYDERLDRRVAIKMLRPPADLPAKPGSPAATEILDAHDRNQKRFLREIRVMAGLELPGIPAIYDSGVDKPEDGSSRLWVVMQLLRGTTLEALLGQTDYESEPLGVAQAAAISAQIAAVLADMHRVDIVHRDIKPANVMLTDGGLVKVLDFGIAILHGAGALPRLTQVGHTVGTPLYMSPEQWHGQTVGTASDIYSLGCLLAELLTGDPPFPVPADSLRAAHLGTPAPEMRSLRDGVPSDLDSLVASMLAKDPAARPTAARVYEALLPFTAPTPGGSGAAAVSAPVSRTGSKDLRDPTRPFRFPLFAPGPDETSPAEEILEEVLTDSDAELLLNRARTFLDIDRPSEAVRLLEKGVAQSRQDPALRLRLRHYLGFALFWAGEYTRAASYLDSAGDDYRKYFGPGDSVVLECAYHAGLAYAESGKPGKALPQLRFYVENADRDSDAPSILETRFIIAQLRAAVGHPEEALADLRTLRPELASAFGQNSTQVRNLDKYAARLSGSA